MSLELCEHHGASDTRGGCWGRSTHGCCPRTNYGHNVLSQPLASLVPVLWVNHYRAGAGIRGKRQKLFGEHAETPTETGPCGRRQESHLPSPI